MGAPTLQNQVGRKRKRTRTISTLAARLLVVLASYNIVCYTSIHTCTDPAARACTTCTPERRALGTYFSKCMRSSRE